MPFMQMENISHFLRACESPPLNMPAHDRFLTVDLYEAKDPAQVLQCLGAFSRTANQLYPHKFRTTTGPKRGAGGRISPSRTGGGLTPSRTGDNGLGASQFGRSRGMSGASSVGNSSAVSRRDGALSPVLTGGSNSSRATEGVTRSPPANVSSWSKKSDQSNSAPAWNIHQYGSINVVLEVVQRLTLDRLHGRRKPRQPRYCIRCPKTNHKCSTPRPQSRRKGTQAP